MTGGHQVKGIDGKKIGAKCTKTQRLSPDIHLECAYNHCNNSDNSNNNLNFLYSLQALFTRSLI